MNYVEVSEVYELRCKYRVVLSISTLAAIPRTDRYFYCICNVTIKQCFSMANSLFVAINAIECFAKLKLKRATYDRFAYLSLINS